MKKRIKFKGCIWSPRIKLKRTIDYTDQEYRLLDILMHISDWDKKHKQTFGTTGESLRDIQSHYLPHWSLGKLSRWMNGLASKGEIERRDDHKIEIRNFARSTELNVQDDEQDNVPSDEQNVQSNERENLPDEQSVHQGEQRHKNQSSEKSQKTEEIKEHSASSVQSDEQAKSPKEQLKKSFKETQTTADEMLLLQKLKDEYTTDIEIPLKRYGLLLVRDSARRVESRIQGGEKVPNRVGYITTLCKEGTTWEDSEEKKREDGFGAPQLEYSEIKPRGKNHRFYGL
jgi:hypothetical protein